MNIFKLIFVLLFLWSGIYTISFAVYGFRKHFILTGVNAVILQIISTVLCVLYIF